LATAAAFAVPTAARAQAPLAVKLGTNSNEANAEAYYAQDAGIFAKNGLAVEMVTLGGGAAIAAAIAGGSLQAGSSNTLSLAVAKSRGLPFIAIAPGATHDTSKPTSMMAVAPDSPVHTAKDLNGKIVAGISIGGLDNLAALAWVDRFGGDAASIKFVEIPPTAIADALEQKRIDAGLLPEPYLERELKRVRTIGKSYDGIGSLFQQVVWVAHMDWVAKNPATARSLAASLLQGEAWALDNPTQAAAILSKYTKQPVDRIRQTTAKAFDPALIQTLLDSAYKYKLLSQPMRAADLIWTGR
jgi:NitT/TauT family transport system substrate-binding protein